MRLEPGLDETAIRRWMVARISDIVGREAAEIDPNASFDTLGVDSMEALSLAGELEDGLEVTLSPAVLYRYPTIVDLARALAVGDLEHASAEQPFAAQAPAEDASGAAAARSDEPVCVVGVGLRFPGDARDPDGFWDNLVNGVDAGTVVPADRWPDAPRLDDDADAPGAVYTNRGAFMTGLADFDAAFFDISPREAVRMDPAQRLLLEVTWEALERSGHAPDRLRGSRTGVFVGMMAGGEYGSLEVTLSGDACLDDPYFGIGTAASVAAGRLAYTLDLRGPAMTLDTACSSSLIAVHLARQSLLRGECDLAIVAGVSAIVHPDTFRQACKMRMLARDGRVKAFDAAADGFLLGEGCGVVVLERRADTLARGGVVEAELLGSAINQDGRSNGLTAPNAVAQESVIRAALADAGILPGDIGYLEAHGSGTLLGDAIEMEVLQQVFGPGRAAEHPLAVGAVKTNIGHLTGASGIAGLIKTVLAVKHGRIPANLHLSERNPNVDWERCPVLLPSEVTPWPNASRPDVGRPDVGRPGAGLPGGAGLRTASVSSFGWSGSNAHVVLRQGAPVPEPARTDEAQLLLVSARTEAALAAAATDLAERLSDAGRPALADVAYTTQVGRSALAYRGSVVGADTDTDRVVRALRLLAEHPTARPVSAGIDTPVGLLLPGTGEQYAGMGAGLYQWNPAFRAAIDECAEAAADPLGLDLRTVLYGDETPAADTAPGGPLHDRLDVAHAAVFAMDYAGARMWAALGVQPAALLGYSLGEFVAACLAGVFPLADAARLVARRAQLIAAISPGAMVTVALPAADLVAMLDGQLSLAADNGPRTSVFSGPAQQVHALCERLRGQRVAHRSLSTDRAMHSAMLEPLREQVAGLIDGIALAAPRIPMVSNVTGSWLTAEQATDGGYWAGHMCATVRFAPAVRALATRAQALVEAGPGQLGSLATQVLLAAGEPLPASVATIRAARDPVSDRATVLRSAGQLWSAGARVDLAAVRDAGRIAALPTYPFERQRFWPVDNRGARDAPVAARAETIVTYRPGWTVRDAERGELREPFLIFAPQSPDAGSVAARVSAALAEAGQCVTVVAGTEAARLGPDRFQVRPDSAEDHRFLAAELARDGLAPRSVVHLWNLTGTVTEPLSPATVRAHQRHGFASLLAAGPALAGIGSGTRIVMVTDHAHAVLPGDVVDPGKATLSGPNLTLPQEYPHLGSRTLDLTDDADPATLAAAVLTELSWPDDAVSVAHRAGRRYVESLQEITGPAAGPGETPPLRRGGVYLITGGLGHLGLLLGEHLVRTSGAKLILTGRSGLPTKADPPAGTPPESTRRIAAVSRLRELGGEVFVGAADVSDPTALVAVLAEGERLFGPVNGVFHAAGHTSADAFAFAADLTAEQCARHFTAKVDGTIALAAVLGDRELDFCLLQSSMSAVLGGLGFGAYAAANAFQDRMVQAMPASWRSVCWDTWRDTLDENATGGVGASLRRFSMTTPDALGALDRLLATGERRSVVSVGELDGRLRQWASGKDPLASVAAGKGSLGSVAAGKGSLGSVASGAAEMFPRPQLAQRFVPARSDYERRVVELWRAALGLAEVGIHDNFFDLGGNSLVGMQLVDAVRSEFGVDVSAVALFEAPTVSSMARYLLANAPGALAPPGPARSDVVASRPDLHGEDIAILSMAGRFPGANSIETFWENLRDGVESIRFFERAELLDAGVPAELLDRPDYVMARPVLEDIAGFDAGFFGYTPWEARLTDPQHRIFLECVSEALERAGYAPRSHAGEIGVFGGANISTYLRSIYDNPELTDSVNDYQMVISNDKDALTLTASYKLNLRGPSVAVQTFCSTALVAVHQGVRALQNGECDLVVAGGVSVRVPDLTGYTFTEGGMESPDGHVRTFDADARGALFGDGCAVVVLKPLSRALADGDTVAAVIKGSAINNDGSLKVGFTAPSVRGQAEVVSRALATAGIEASSISYIEAHGTATELGDPIEVAALIKAFGSDARPGYCALGSVKTNVGHLDRAAGTTGLIKAVLSLQHEQIPATLHFRRPNPEIDVETSPFYVNDRLSDWKREPGRPRRAGVSSLGMGGTNAHVVIEEAPPIEPGTPSLRRHVFVLSAQTATALDTMARQLGAFLGANPAVDLADAAYTLQVGRDRFAHRLAFVAADVAAARAVLAGDVLAGGVYRWHERSTDRGSAFLFGDRPLAPEFASRLLAVEPAFVAAIDECVEAAASLVPRLATVSLAEQRSIAAGATGGIEVGASTGDNEVASALAVFAGGYALARLLISWGVRPEALVGRGGGEYVAVCLSGALSVAEALGLAVRRGSVAELTAWAAEHVRPRLAHTPVLSTVTGDWLQAEEVADPAYWGRQVGAPVMWERAREAAVADDPQRIVVAFTEGGWTPADRTVIELGSPDAGPADGGPADGGLAAALAQMWPAGVAIDWAAVHAGERRLRLLLPTYPFERQRYWIDANPDGLRALAAASGHESDPERRFASAVRESENNWIYLPVWQQIPDPSPSAIAPNWLLFTDTEDSRGLTTALREKGSRVVEVRPGAGFTREAPDGFTVRMHDRDDHGALLRLLGAEGFAAQRAVFLSGPDPDPQRTFDTLMALTQAIADAGTASCRITVVTAGAFDVDGEGRVNPALATIVGPVRTIGLEYPALTCDHVDIAAGLSDPGARLLTELLADGTEPTVVLRGRRRWVRRFRRKEQPPVGAGSVLRERGAYLITGGLGGIGLAMAGHLATELSARLVLTGRDGLPDEDTWDDLLAAADTPPETVRRITAVRKLRADGAEVLVVGADVTTAEGVRTMIAAATRVYGALDGVLHAAGVPGTGLLQFKTPQQAGSVLAPKVAGTRMLRTELAAAGVDLLVLFSSTAALSGGGPGQADYCSANAYLDAVANSAEHGDGPRTVSVNWCEWQWNAWDVELAGFDPRITAFLRANRARMGLTFEEGWRSLLRALAVGAPQVAVSSQDLDELVEVTGQFSIAVLSRTARQPGVRHPRPALVTPFVPAESEPATTIAGVWADALGVTEVGMHDSFFDLGGNSLIGLDLVMRLRAALDCPTLPPHLLYEAPTVADMAHFVKAGGGDSEAEAAEIEQGRRRGAWRRESAIERTRRTTEQSQPAVEWTRS